VKVRCSGHAGPVLLAVASLGASGCDLSAGPASPDGPTPIAIRLHLFSGNDCPLVGFPRQLTFRIDPIAADQVVVLEPDGTSSEVWWPDGFRGGTSDDPVVRDPHGLIVARNGEVLAIPKEGFPRLHGYTVCAGDGYYVQPQGL
jgi:hypothetical protein